MGRRCGRPELAALLLLASVGAAGVRSAEASTLEPDPSDEESHTESWTAIADFGDGGYLQLQLAISNLGPGTGHGLCRMTYAAPGAEVLSRGSKVDREAWKFHAGPSPRLEVGACTMSSRGGALSIQTNFEDASASLELGGLRAAVHPPGSRIEVEDGRYEFEILVASGAAEATLALPSGKTRELRGRGYSDHSNTNLLPGDVARHWVRFRALDEAEPLLLVYREGPEDEPARASNGPGYSWHPRGEPERLEALSLEQKGEEPAPNWRIASPEGLTLTSESLLFRHAPVEDLGVLGRLVSPFVGNPVTWTYRASYEDTRRGRRGAGILEVTLVR